MFNFTIEGTLNLTNVFISNFAELISRLWSRVNNLARWDRANINFSISICTFLALAGQQSAIIDKNARNERALHAYVIITRSFSRKVPGTLTSLPISFNSFPLRKSQQNNWRNERAHHPSQNLVSTQPLQILKHAQCLSLSLSLFGSRDRAQLAVLLATKTISLHGEWSIAILLSSLVNKTATLSRNFLFQRRVDGARIGNSWENTSSVDYDFDLFVRSLFTVWLFGFFLYRGERC